MADKPKKVARKSKIEKQIELVKYLHEPHSERDIELKFDCTDRTVRNLFEDEISFMSTIFPLKNRQIQGEFQHLSDSYRPEKGSSTIESADYKYRSTVHPIFLALNMTEVYMLTYHLLELVEASSREELNLYKHLVEKIYSQLSEPTRLRIDKNGRNRYHLRSNDLVKYESEEELFPFYKEGVLLYGLKSGEKVRIRLKDGTILEGTIDYHNQGFQLIRERKDKLNISDLKNRILMIEKIK